MSRLAASFVFLCFLNLVPPVPAALAQDAKPDEPLLLKATGLSFKHANCKFAIFSPDGRLLVTAGGGLMRTDGGLVAEKRGILVWDAATGKLLNEAITGPAGFEPPEITPDGKFLVQIPPPVMFGKEPIFEVRWWELPGLKPVGAPLKFKSKACLVAVGPAGLLLTAEGTGGAPAKASSEISLRELTTGKLVGKPWTVKGRIDMVAFRPDGKQVFIGSGTVERYDVSSGTQVGKAWGLGVTKGGGSDGRLKSVHFDPENKFAVTIASASSGADGNIFVIRRWNLETDKSVGDIHAPREMTPYARQLVGIHNDARTVAVTTKDKLNVRVLDLETGKAICPDLKHRDPVSRLIFSPDGKRLLTAGGADGCWLWDLPTGQRAARVPQKGETRLMTFRPDGKSLVTGGVDGTVTLWELPAQK